MPQDARYRVKLTFSEDEHESIEKLCASWSRWLPPATSIRQMMLVLAENLGAIQKVGTPGAQTTPDGPEVTQAVLAENLGAIRKVGTPGAQTTPDGPEVTHAGTGPSHGHTPIDDAPHTPARARKIPEKKKKKEKRKRGGSVRGGQSTLIGTEPPPVSEPFMREALGHLNEVCGTSFPLFDKPVRELVAKLLADGYSVDDIKVVNTWADKNWPRPNPGEKDWRATMLVPSRLYGAKFGEHLGVARCHADRTKKEPASWRPDFEDMCENK